MDGHPLIATGGGATTPKGQTLKKKRTKYNFFLGKKEAQNLSYQNIFFNQITKKSFLKRGIKHH
jgi:hypothetical protein